MRILVFPFKFEFIYVPFLPAILMDYLYIGLNCLYVYRNAPVPYLMGIEEYMLKSADDNINNGTYIINLDSN